MLANDGGKLLAKLIRRTLMPLANKMTLNSQCGGGLNGGEAAIAHFYIRNIVDISHVEGVSCAVLFLDIVTAFATLLRRIVFDVCHSDERWLMQLRDSGFSQDEIKSIYECVCSSLWSCDGSDLHAARLAEQFYVNTWISTEGISKV